MDQNWSCRFKCRTIWFWRWNLKPAAQNVASLRLWLSAQPIQKWRGQRQWWVPQLAMGHGSNSAGLSCFSSLSCWPGKKYQIRCFLIMSHWNCHVSAEPSSHILFGVRRDLVRRRSMKPRCWLMGIAQDIYLFSMFFTIQYEWIELKKQWLTPKKWMVEDLINI